MMEIPIATDRKIAQSVFHNFRDRLATLTRKLKSADFTYI